MKREGVSTLFICSYLRALSFLLDHLVLFENMLCDVGLKIFWKHLCNDSRFYKNAYKVLVLKIVQRGVCLWKMILKGILKSAFV